MRTKTDIKLQNKREIWRTEDTSIILKIRFKALLIRPKLHREETEIQIKLTELQVDIEIYLAITIGLLAGIIAVAAIAFQVYPLLKTNDLGIIAAYPALVILEFVFLYYSLKSVNKLQRKRKELKKLREKYLW